MSRFFKVLCLSLFVFIAIPSTALAGGKDSTFKANNQFDWDPVINAIIQVESKGDKSAIRGNSCGVLQITPVLVYECNQILRRKKSKKRFKLSDRFKISKSKEMFILMQSFYNPMNSIERAIRSWNGGMHYSISRTQKYFEKVMAKIK